jgi:2-hydroxy-3-oxopropionate reductase
MEGSMKIGFIGLGIMGKPMVKNLIKAGHELIVFDHHKENMDNARAAGALAVSSAAEAASQVPVVITMLPNSPHVKAAVLGEKGILEGAKPGTILIDMSSIAPLASREVEKTCAAKGINMIDAPVSGGEPKAIDGTLAIMAGGDIKVFEKVKPILLSMGSTAVYCGAIGAGNTTKLANQIVVALNIAAAAEALTLVKKAGVDPQLVFEAIRGGLAGSTVLNAKAPMMIESNFKPGFKIDLHIKDLANALDTAHGAGAPLPLTSLVREMMETLHADGFGQDDHSALARYYAKVSGTSIGVYPPPGAKI